MASRSRRRKQRRARTGESIEAALISLDRSRGPLFQEMTRIAEHRRRERKRKPRPEETHLACTRQFNRMRITDLEAIDIARAFAEKPHLRGKLPQVYERIAKELPHLRDIEEPQAFDCPLLEGTQCMVHHVAKPIACLAWNAGREFSSEAWHSFSRRDRLNRDLFGTEWQLKSIPLQLTRFLEGEDRLVEGKCGSTLRKLAMRKGELKRTHEKAVAEREAREAEKQQRRGRRGAARHERNRGGDGAPATGGRRKSRVAASDATGPSTKAKKRRPGSPGAGDRQIAGKRLAAKQGAGGRSAGGQVAGNRRRRVIGDDLDSYETGTARSRSSRPGPRGESKSRDEGGGRRRGRS